MNKQNKNLNEVTIGVTTVAFSKNNYLVDLIKSKGFQKVKTNVAGQRFSHNELIEFLRDCDAAIVGLDKINESVLQHLPKLNVIGKYGVGLDNINLPDCENNNVDINYSLGVNKRSVAELTLGYMLSLLRNIHITSQKLQKGIWYKNGGTQLTGKTVGIIGVGNIGKDLISLLKPFNCRILVNDIISQKDYYLANNILEVSKETIYKQADIITVHTPLTKLTRQMINIETIKLMKSTAIIINTARGGIVNQKDLKQALLEGKIAGAALDVYDMEPPEDKELLEIPNLIATPHIGGNSAEAVKAMGISAIENVLSYFQNLNNSKENNN